MSNNGPRSPNQPQEPSRADRINIAEQLYVRGFKKWQIKNALVEQYHVSLNTAEQDYSHAKARLEAESDTEKSKLRIRVGDALQDILRSPHTEDRDKIRALEAIAKLWGLNQLPVTEPQADKVVIEVGNWREEFRKKAESGTLKSPSGNGSKTPE